MSRLQLGVFASGRGSNFSAILEAVDKNKLDANIRVLISNNRDAGALNTAKARGIPAVVVNRRDFSDRRKFVGALLKTIQNNEVDFIALAGYMKKIPPEIVEAYPNRILNIHPALLPSFGGQGMYGGYVHEAVLKAGCKLSGVTVHLVDNQYDRGPIVAQCAVGIVECEKPEEIAAKVLREEHRLFAEALQLFAEDRVLVRDGLARIKAATPC